MCFLLAEAIDPSVSRRLEELRLQAESDKREALGVMAAESQPTEEIEMEAGRSAAEQRLDEARESCRISALKMKLEMEEEASEIKSESSAKVRL